MGGRNDEGAPRLLDQRLLELSIFCTNRPCRLAPAHQGMKIGCIGWWESSSVIATTRTSPLDSRLRGNDELRGRNDEIAEWRGSTARSKAAWAHFRTNDEMGGDSTGATYFPTNNERRGADYEEYPPADHHAVEHKGVGQCTGYDVRGCWLRSRSPFELPSHFPEG